MTESLTTDMRGDFVVDAEAKQIVYYIGSSYRAADGSSYSHIHVDGFHIDEGSTWRRERAVDLESWSRLKLAHQEGRPYFYNLLLNMVIERVPE